MGVTSDNILCVFNNFFLAWVVVSIPISLKEAPKRWRFNSVSLCNWGMATLGFKQRTVHVSTP